MIITTAHKLQIAREIEKFNDYTIAKFFYGDTDEMLCTAWFQSPSIRRIKSYDLVIDMEKASALSIAIGMAIEWLSEQEE